MLQWYLIEIYYERLSHNRTITEILCLKEHAHHVERDPLENIICAVDAKITIVLDAVVRILALALHQLGEE